MSYLTKAIKTLPIPDEFYWDEDGQAIGIRSMETNWWHWFIYHTNYNDFWKKHDVCYHNPKIGSQTKSCVIEDLYEAAQFMSAKMCLGLYE